MKGVLVLGKPHEEEGGPDYGAEDMDSEASYQDTASEAISALQAEDASGFARAMKSFVKQCMMEENEQ